MLQSTPAADSDRAPPTTEAPPASIAARLDLIAPGDHARLAALLREFPEARPALLAAAATRLGNATVQRAISETRAGDTATQATTTANEFYAAFARRDATAMRAHYAPAVSFHDPLFGKLHGAEQVMRMWTTIMPKANPFQITPAAATAPVARGDGTFELRVHWDAFYGLGSARIHNHSDTTLVIANGAIVEQRDEWNLDAWTAQALPHHLGGNRVADLLVAAAAHSFIEVADLIARHRG